MINSDERFTRWQQVLREHFSYLNNLILTFSIGVLAFLMSLLNDEDFSPNCCQKIFFSTGVILSFISIFFGLATSLCRLLDFRTTVRKIKKEINKDNSELAELKNLMDIYGKSTWNLFYSQIASFFLAVISLTIAFLMIFQDKLF